MIAEEDSCGGPKSVVFNHEICICFNDYSSQCLNYNILSQVLYVLPLPDYQLCWEALQSSMVLSIPLLWCNGLAHYHETNRRILIPLHEPIMETILEIWKQLHERIDEMFHASCCLDDGSVMMNCSFGCLSVNRLRFFDELLLELEQAGYENCYEDDLQEDGQHVYLLMGDDERRRASIFHAYVKSGNRS
ncbi:hypothetical protein POTOM_040563 [Populus tomentosa]|uniref:Uncharacterized protein n=1 Tax=Populus tomentosa TaxID=118781 RepID=A0A8X7YP99_POPTO|nr:hypothetical protein POTOM_040563 [Populus tomentosa]